MAAKKVLVMGLDYGINANVCNVLRNENFEPFGFVFNAGDVENEIARVISVVSQNKFDGAVIGHGVQKNPELLQRVTQSISETDGSVKLILVSGPSAVLSDTRSALSN